MTSEDKTNVNPAEVAEKPKRGRKRKTEIAAVNTESLTSTSTIENTDIPPTSSSALPNEQALAHQTSEEKNEDTDSPEEYGAALAMDSSPQPVTPHVIGSGCGSALKAARETQGLSIHEVSSQLRLGIKQIQAIEQDDFDKLPQPSIVRGFIRNYARLLNVDVQPILEAYQRIVPNNAPLPLNVRSNGKSSVIDQPSGTLRPQRVLILLFILALVAAAAYFYINQIKPHGLKDISLAPEAIESSNSTEQEIALPPPEPALENVDTVPPAAETSPMDANTNVDQTVGPDTQATPSIINSTNATEPTANNSVSNTIVSTPTPATSQAVESTTLQATNAQNANLTFKVTEDSWVRIEDVKGKTVFSEVLPAGTERQVMAEKPVNITVGHAAGTKLTIDNQPYDLTQATRGRVARIQLK